MRLGCGECQQLFDTPEGLVDHLLVTRHMGLPIEAESNDVRELVAMFAQIQAHAATGAPLPEGSSLQRVTEDDVEDDDELTDEKKAELLAWMRAPLPDLPLSLEADALPDPASEVLGFRALGDDGWVVELYLTKGQPRGELRGSQHGTLRWRHAVGLREVALFKAAADEVPGAQPRVAALIEALQARYVPETP